jgi:hypothetical protein
MPVAKHSFPCLHHLHLQLFSLILSPLVLVGRRQVAYAGQRVRMLVAKHSFPCLHYLHLQLFHFSILSIAV